MYLYSIPEALRHPLFLYKFNKVRKRIRRIRPIDDFRVLQARIMSESLRGSVDDAAALIKKIVYERWEFLLRKVRPYAGVRELIAYLQQRQFKLGVLSDFPVKRKLNLLGLDGHWDCAFSSEETGYLKPNPEPFFRLAECLETDPEHILYIGNSYRYDVIGAKNAGLRTAHLTSKSKKDSLADVSFKKYGDLRQWIQKNVQRE
jgi:putative hydrolase of the HAD superfamily